MAVRPSTERIGEWPNFVYNGILRDGKTLIWNCGHLHSNRNVVSRYNPTSAESCACRELRRRNALEEEG